MGKPKGSTKVGGRVKGTPNKITKDIKENFKEFVEGNFENVQGWLDRVAAVDPDKALNLYLQFSERILGRISSSSLDVTSNGKSISQPTIHVYGSSPTED